MALNIELDMTVEDGREVNMSVDPIDEVSFGVGEAVVVRDHAILTNRDLSDQHPISAITGLAEALAQSGKIDTVKQNGVALPVVDKAVNVIVPTKTSDLTNDSGFITGISSSDVVSALGYTPGTYSKPQGGIPKSDLSSAVQSSLNLADSSVQAINYDFGTVTLNSNNMFQITQEQYNAVKELWDSGELCSVSCTVNGESFYAVKQNMQTLNNIPFMGFVGTSIRNNAPVVVVIGVSQYLVAGLLTMDIPDPESMEWTARGVVFDYDTYGAVFPRVGISEYSGGTYQVDVDTNTLHNMATSGQGYWYNVNPRYVLGFMETYGDGFPQMFILYDITIDGSTETFKWYSVREYDDGNGAVVEIDILTTSGSSSQRPMGTITTYTIPNRISQLTNDSGYITGITSSDVTTALGYTPASPSDLSNYLNKTTGGAVNGYISLKKSTDSTVSPGVHFDAKVNGSDVRWSVYSANNALYFSNGTPVPDAKVVFYNDGTITAKTQSAGNNSNRVATTAFVTSAIASAQVGMASFQGTISSNTTLENLSDYKKGMYWVVDTAGTYVGQTCEPGDMIFCISDRSSAYSASDFSVVQNNINLVAMTNAEIDAIIV